MTMTRQQIEEVERIAIAHFGPGAQKHKAIEECAEFTHALIKYDFNRCGSAAVIEEIADVMIMMDQMRLIFGPAEVDEAIQAKIRRLLRRLETT